MKKNFKHKNKTLMQKSKQGKDKVCPSTTQNLIKAKIFKMVALRGYLGVSL